MNIKKNQEKRTPLKKKKKKAKKEKEQPVDINIHIQDEVRKVRHSPAMYLNSSHIASVTKTPDSYHPPVIWPQSRPK